MNKTLKTLVPNDIIIFIEFRLSNQVTLNSLNLSTNKPVSIERINQIKNILLGVFQNSFTPAIIKDENKNVDCNIFIPILYKNNQVAIPGYMMDNSDENRDVIDLLKN